MHTINDMLDKYARDAVPKLSERTRVDYGRHIKSLRAAFGNRDIRSVAHQEVIDYIGPRVRGYTQKIRHNAVLRSAYNYAIKWGWVDGNPCTQIEKSQPRKREPLTMELFEKALKLASKKTALVMELVLHTGRQQGDIIRLKWSHVDLGAGTILFRPARDKKPVLVRITPAIRALLDRAKEVAPGKVYVVTNADNTCYTSAGFRALYQRLLKKWDETGRERIVFHDIIQLHRTTFENPKVAKAAGDPVDDFPQFSATLKVQAALNAPFYKVFFCLEQVIRQQVTDTLEKAAGKHRWDSDKIPQELRREVAALATKELDTGITQRSPRQIDYTTFGQLGQIIRENWDLFEKQFKTTKGGVSNILAKLNYARGPIAHCCPLSTLEIERLGLTVRDWFGNLAA